MAKIRTAVFPVAGRGTRFLPATKASPKEMLPVVDKPLIQYAVEEAAAAGITDMVFITGRNKRAIEDHFDKAYELETELAARHKTALLETVQSATPSGINCIYIRQTEALGLGHDIGSLRPGKAADFIHLKPPAGSVLEGALQHASRPEDMLAALFTLGGDESVREVRVEGAVVHHA